ncbi:MAG: hypothetical protein ACYS9C_06675 [Planctomycetota bacterium]|jgi:hypothetical protein
MKKLTVLLVAGLIVVAGSYASASETNVNNINQLQSEQKQNQTMQGQGYAGANANINTVSNYKTRTPPVSMFPPYLPYWTHGGWGTVKAYFPNGPNSDDQVYERRFNPGDPDEMKELRSVLESLSYEGPLNAIGGILNGIGVAFGGPDNFHHGRGFEIANSLVRTPRPRKKPLLVFIDSNVDRNLLREAGYAYVGKVSLEGKVNRNWDHVYDAAVAETLPWDVDILLVSGGMKGVTVGSNTTFPVAGGAYTQLNYSLSLFGGRSNGITEGKGKALVSAEGYRYWPAVVSRRRIPKYLYDRIRPGLQKPEPTQDSAKAAQEIPPATAKEKYPGIRVSQQLFDMAEFEKGQQVDNISIK